MGDGPSEAKQTLLRALEEIEECERELETPVEYLCVTYCVDTPEKEANGVPTWALVAHLRRCADLAERGLQDHEEE